MSHFVAGLALGLAIGWALGVAVCWRVAQWVLRVRTVEVRLEDET